MGAPLYPAEPVDTEDAPLVRMARASVDWTPIRRDYGTTHMTDAELAEVHGVSVNNIRINRARHPDLWPRNLRSAMANATEEALIRAGAQASSRGADFARMTVDQQVAATVALNVAVIQRHRSEITRAAAQVSAMLAEVTAAGLAQADIDLTIAILQHEMPDASEDDLRRAASVIQKSTQLETRAKVLGQLADTMVKLQHAERKAWNLDTEAPAQVNQDFAARLTAARMRAAQRIA